MPLQIDVFICLEVMYGDFGVGARGHPFLKKTEIHHGGTLIQGHRPTQSFVVEVEYCHIPVLVSREQLVLALRDLYQSARVLVRGGEVPPQDEGRREGRFRQFGLLLHFQWQFKIVTEWWIREFFYYSFEASFQLVIINISRRSNDGINKHMLESHMLTLTLTLNASKLRELRLYFARIENLAQIC